MKEPEKNMDIYFAVFNNHVNRAHFRVRSAFVKKFGPGAWKKSGMAKFAKDGIMAIFDQSPTEFTKFYAEQVMKFVNEERA